MAYAEDILAFVKKQGGARWIDLEKEFVIKRQWSKGRFVSHWKQAKKFLEKVKDPKTKTAKYMIKKEAETYAQKALLRTNIYDSDLHKVTIDPSRLVPIVKNKALEAKPYFLKQSFLKIAAKVQNKKPEPLSLSACIYGSALASELWAERYTSLLREIAERMEISVFTPKGETPPELTEEDVQKIFEVLYIKLLDKNKGALREKPFYIVISLGEGTTSTCP